MGEGFHFLRLKYVYHYLYYIYYTNTFVCILYHVTGVHTNSELVYGHSCIAKYWFVMLYCTYVLICQLKRT